MSLFQNSVLNKYLKGLEPEKIEKAYQRFTSHFHNPTIQENIRNSKEEQYQGEFLIDLFVNVLGYTKNPTPDFNLTTELKNIKGSKKTDGAILKDEKALAVIELKGTNTTDLSKVETQAFGYKNNQPGCNYVITSNFEKLRFYIDNAVDFEEFNLFQLTKERFEILCLCLSSEYLLKDIPKKIKDESLTQEENVTKKLYKDYASFRNEIFDAIQKENPAYDKLTLFKKTQKLLDRFLFIFFAEDRLLLPPNSIRSIVNQWTDLKDKYDEYFPLYNRFKKYFGYMNTGHKGQQHDIFAYNGGLFAPDEILDNIKINDDLLYKHTLNLSNYDFESEVSVNILGHIFEHSLNDIDEIQAEIQGVSTEQSKTKRKKDGVFYTPKYITKYIVENTVGKLCDEKKTELDIKEAEYEKERKGRQKATLKKLSQKLEDYRKWLLQITICDPACGSGAFLNQALEFLITEHQYIDELQAKLFGDAMVLSEVENAILENNLFGVDINEESVEIAKLSLWLRTAQKGRKLTSLNNNIKCGNSLIDDPSVAGDKAFNWQKEFPEVFAKGGFDVIIGNPPYLRIQGLKDAYPIMVDFYNDNFKSATGNYDIYVLFIEKCQKLISYKGLVSFILPHKFLISEFGEGIRSVFKEKRNIIDITHFQEHLVFSDATTYTCIITYTNLSRNNFKFRYINPTNLFEDSNFFDIAFNDLNEDKWNINNPKVSQIIEKINKQPNTIGKYIKVFSGIQTSGDKIYIIEGRQDGNYITGYSKSLEKNVSIEQELMKNIIKGDRIKRYSNIDSDLFVLFPYDLINDKAVPILEHDLQKRFPKGYEYLLEHEQILRGREKGKMDKDGWFLYVYPKNLVTSNLPKIVSPDITMGLQLTKDVKGVCVKNGAYGISIKENYNISEMLLMAVLNSNLLWFFLKNTGNVLRGGYFRFNTKYINPFPVFDLENQKYIFEKNVSLIIEKNEKISKLIQRYINRINSSFEIEKLSNKHQTFYNYDFKTFIGELKKKKVKLSLTEQDEWEEYFDDYKKEINEHQAQINKIDKEIDQMVYELYGLSEEEISIVENS